MKKLTWIIVIIMVSIGILLRWIFFRMTENDLIEKKHYDRQETELIVSDLAGVRLQLFQAGKNLSETTSIADFRGKSIWLSKGNYFLQTESGNRLFFQAVPLTGFRSGPDEDGEFWVTIRPLPKDFPPRMVADHPDYIYIPSGTFRFGNRLDAAAPHYVWLPAFFMAPFELSNGEFREFIKDPAGYAENSNWTEAGKLWKAKHSSHCTALLKPGEKDYQRFGLPDQPVTWVTWFEAHAFCKWLTKTIGDGKWEYSLPNEAEWEKAARGPDNFDYSLGMNLGEPEVQLYNWKKNPDAPVTVVGFHDTPLRYRPNRYGLYHMTGNVVEWTQTTDKHSNQLHPWADDERNHEDTPGVRIARGGSWYSASNAYLYIPYRDSFQPEHSSQDTGFRLIAKRLP